MSLSTSFSSSPLRVPFWAQLAIGIVLVVLIFLILASSAYVSAWDEEDSNFYEAATQALKMRGLSPSAPTVFVFWDQDCSDCEKSIKALHTVPPQLRVYGVHLSDSGQSEQELRSQWIQLSPPASILLIDQDQFLQTSFRVRTVPTAFLYLPKHKKVFSYLGDINRNKKKMLEILSTDSFK